MISLRSMWICITCTGLPPAAAAAAAAAAATGSPSRTACATALAASSGSFRSNPRTAGAAGATTACCPYAACCPGAPVYPGTPYPWGGQPVAPGQPPKPNTGTGTGTATGAPGAGVPPGLNALKAAAYADAYTACTCGECAPSPAYGGGYTGCGVCGGVWVGVGCWVGRFRAGGEGYLYPANG